MDEILLTQKVSATNHEALEFLDSDYDANDLYKVDQMSLEETKENFDWRKCAFEDEKKNSYAIKNRHDMICIHNNVVKNISECNFFRYINNRPKRTKNLNSRCSPILHECMNTRKVWDKFKNFRSILDSVCSSTIFMGRLVEKL